MRFDGVDPANSSFSAGLANCSRMRSRGPQPQVFNRSNTLDTKRKNEAEEPAPFFAKQTSLEVQLHGQLNDARIARPGHGTESKPSAAATQRRRQVRHRSRRWTELHRPVKVVELRVVRSVEHLQPELEETALW